MNSNDIIIKNLISCIKKARTVNPNFNYLDNSLLREMLAASTPIILAISSSLI